MKQWSEVKSEFETDGSLRDIYVENIGPAIWNLFIEEVKRSRYAIEFSHGDTEMELPADLGIIKRLQETDPTILRIWLPENIQLNCHFFLETEIELDVSPYDIQNENAYMELLCFLEWLASLTGLKVKVTHEGMQEQVILSVCK